VKNEEHQFSAKKIKKKKKKKEENSGYHSKTIYAS
jgi:hypothetical protein